MPDLLPVILTGRRRRPVAVRSLLNLVALAALVVLLLFVWLQVVKTLTATVHPPAPVGTPNAVAWGGRVFSSQAKLEAWLRERGISYSVWARRHRGAVSIVGPGSAAVSAPHRSAAAKGTAAKSSAAKGPAAKSPAAKGPAVKSPAAKSPTASSRLVRRAVPASSAAPPRAASASATGSSGSRTGGSNLPNGLLWACALLLGAVAVAPRRLIARVSTSWLGPDQRTILAAAAGSLAFGLIVASWTS